MRRALVTFTLEDTAGGTLLTVRETGFDAISPERRANAFADNEHGWKIQMTLIEKYIAQEST